MLKYKLIERGNPANREQPKKWYATPVKAGNKNLKQLSENISGRSSLTRGDIQNVLLNLLDEIPKFLLDGFTVQLGDLGSMRVNFSSDGVEHPDEFHVSKIKGERIIFTPSVEFKEMLDKAGYERINGPVAPPEPEPVQST